MGAVETFTSIEILVVFPLFNAGDVGCGGTGVLVSAVGAVKVAERTQGFGVMADFRSMKKGRVKIFVESDVFGDND